MVLAGFSAVASLYRYIDGRDDLVLAAVKEIFAATPLPDREVGWRAYLEAEATIRWELLNRYAGLLPDNAGALAATATRRLDLLVRDLVALGFDIDAAVLAVDAVVDLIQDGVTQAKTLRDPADPTKLNPVLETAMGVYSPQVRAAVQRIIDAPRDHVWRKLELLLEGIAAGVSVSGGCGPDGNTS